MKLEDVRYQSSGNIATITLDREDARNAYSDAMVVSLVRAFDEAERDDAIRCVILTGAGPTFHSGGDLKRMQEHSGMFEGGPVALRRKYIDGIQQIPRRLGQFDKPIIAAINGAAIGAGLDLACMCDMRIAVEGTKFGSTFVKVGLVPGDGGAYFLGRTIGFSRALELVLTGRLVECEEALTIGLVNRVVTAEGLMSTAQLLAEEISANAPLAVRLTKRAAYRSFDMGMESALELAASYQGMVQNTADHREAVAAILGKRSPTFHGE